MRVKMIFLFWFFAVSLWPQNPFGNDRQNEQLARLSQNRFHFAVVGDRTGAGPESWAIFDRAVSELNPLRPDFCVMVGDLIEGGSDRMVIQQQWGEAVRHLDSLNMPVFFIPGNHDISGPQSYSVWNERLGKTYFSFDYRGCHFLILNTEEFQGTGEPGFGSRQVAFAEQDIVKNKNTGHFFVLMHQPAWVSSGVLKSQWTRMESLLPEARVTIVAGHLHALAMKKQNGRTYLIAGPTGGKLRLERNPFLGLFQQVTWLTIENGQSTMAFIEPGRILPEKTALDAYDRYLKGLLLLKGAVQP